MKILFVNHKKSQCGVYEFGRNVGRALTASSDEFLYRECGSTDELKILIEKNAPDLIVYNYNPATMSWLKNDFTKKIKVPQVGIIHEVTQQVADKADNNLFNFHIAHDPTLLLKNPLVFKAGRLIPHYENKFDLLETPVIGSFGFAGKKGHTKIVEKVQQEFDKAVVRFNIPFAAFGDADGAMARAIADDCRRILMKPNIELKISHEFLEEPELLDFLAQNTVNLFLYEQMNEPRGISGTPDLALAVRRPIGISRQSMFRHILGASPSICVEDSSIKEIIAHGFAPLEPFYNEWTAEMMRWDYERIAEDILSRRTIPAIRADGLIKKVAGKGKRFIKRKLGGTDGENASWIGDTSIKNNLAAPLKNAKYEPVALPDDWSLNNILDDAARQIYQPAIKQMFGYLPDLMNRKIAEANVQQAFVLDTVYRIAKQIEKPKILCVGSFEDSAAESLKLLGFQIEETDPMINYDLNVFMTKPTTSENSYDIVFSTSVLEHVEDDEEFMRHVAALLKPNGTAILTCDYADTYQAGDQKPSVDFRLYTQADFRERLLPQMKNCKLVDEPQWDCPAPDFWYEGSNYTFATIVLKKSA